MPKFKVYVSDYDYPDLEIERSVLEPIDAEVIGLKCNTGEELVELARWAAQCCDNSYENMGRPDSYLTLGSDWARVSAYRCCCL